MEGRNPRAGRFLCIPVWISTCCPPFSSSESHGTLIDGQHILLTRGIERPRADFGSRKTQGWRTLYWTAW